MTGTDVTDDQQAPAQAPRERTYGIAELAAEFGLTPRTIRFYEETGLLAPRRAGTARVYAHRDRARLMLICRGRRLGFSLAEIKEFLSLYDADRSQVAQMTYLLARVRERAGVLESRLHDAQQGLAELQALEAQLVGHLRRCGAGSVAAAPASSAADGPAHSTGS